MGNKFRIFYETAFQAFLVFVKVSTDLAGRAGAILRVVSLLPTYVCFVILVSTVASEATASVASKNTFALLIAVSVLKMLEVALQVRMFPTSFKHKFIFLKNRTIIIIIIIIIGMTIIDRK
jgi:hypothetical protein